MDLGSNFLTKLEPFLLMGKSVKGAAAAKLIQDATAAPGVFVFSELLELPNIQELEKSEKFAKHLLLLQLFSYKTYQDYLQHKDALPPLTRAQITKLKHLSLVTLAADRRILPYSELLRLLDMPNVRELEDLIIDAIYLDILRGKLDQKEGQLEVEYTMGRDLEPGKLESILSALHNWSATTASVLATLDEKINHISSETKLNKARQAEYENLLQSNLKDILDRKEKQNMANRRTALGERENVPMDVDEPPLELMKGKNRKASQEANPKIRKRNKF
ncbi:COP9 signalosome complex subunit 7a [Leucoagaricus sp. SymC.cos]|nr:COP9 signalosome complex subunit 7a [Leucoagaricus sp. SymC.cos]